MKFLFWKCLLWFGTILMGIVFLATITGGEYRGAFCSFVLLWLYILALRNEMKY